MCPGFLAFLGLCSAVGPSPVVVSVFAQADRVHVHRVPWTNHLQDCPTRIATTDTDQETSDRSLVDAYYRLIASQPKEWHRIMFDAPALNYSVEFFKDGKRVADYGVGCNFIELYPYMLTLKADQQQLAARLESETFSMHR